MSLLFTAVFYTFTLLLSGLRKLLSFRRSGAPIIVGQPSIS